MIQGYNNFVNRMDAQLSTKENVTFERHPKGFRRNFNFSKITKLQKMDSLPFASTLSGIARIVLAVFTCLLNLARGEGKKALENVKQIGRGVAVSVPLLNVLWTQKFDTKEAVKQPFSPAAAAAAAVVNPKASSDTEDDKLRSDVDQMIQSAAAVTAAADKDDPEAFALASQQMLSQVLSLVAGPDGDVTQGLAELSSFMREKGVDVDLSLLVE